MLSCACRSCDSGVACAAWLARMAQAEAAVDASDWERPRRGIMQGQLQLAPKVVVQVLVLQRGDGTHQASCILTRGELTMLQTLVAPTRRAAWVRMAEWCAAQVEQ